MSVFKLVPIFLIALFFIFTNCAKKEEEETIEASNFPDISTITTSPSSQFIIDTSLISTSAISRTMPFSGSSSSCSHAGAHIHFQQTSSTSLVDVYAPVDGTIGRLDKCFVVGSNDKYEIGIDFANNGGNLTSLSLSLEPFGGFLCSGGTSGNDNGAYHGYILVNEGDTVVTGQVIARMLVPSGSADDTHIHFHLNTDTVGFSCQNIFSSSVSSIFDDKFSATGCSGGPYADGGLCSQPGANEDITSLD